MTHSDKRPDRDDLALTPEQVCRLFPAPAQNHSALLPLFRASGKTT
jgi:hypothetical protein